MIVQIYLVRRREHLLVYISYHERYRFKSVHEMKSCISYFFFLQGQCSYHQAVRLAAPVRHIRRRRGSRPHSNSLQSRARGHVSEHPRQPVQGPQRPAVTGQGVLPDGVRLPGRLSGSLEKT